MGEQGTGKSNEVRSTSGFNRRSANAGQGNSPFFTVSRPEALS